MRLPKHPVSQTTHERGVALLISIFALLLISGVAISLIVMSGTEAAIAGNAKGRATRRFFTRPMRGWKKPAAACGLPIRTPWMPPPA